MCYESIPYLRDSLVKIRTKIINVKVLRLPKHSEMYILPLIFVHRFMSWYCHNAAWMLKVKVKASLWSEWRELPHRVPLRQRLCGSWLLWTLQCCTRIEYVLSLLPSPLSVFTQVTLCTLLQVRMVNHVLVWPVRLCPMPVVLESLPGMPAAPNVVCRYTVDRESFAAKNFSSTTFSDEN